ncbi:DMT family transporter [Larkinella bovis]|uniref:DMT family transporter n=1 Tax=Larkinella bovis TaxID=683041 RepID=A0ABW0I9E4_9BACT
MDGQKIRPGHNLTDRQRGLLLGLVGVICFSFTVPMTKLTLGSLNPWLVSFGRIAGAGLISLVILYQQGKLFLIRKHFRTLVGISFGVGLGFPVLMTVAMYSTSSSHAGIVLALLPLTTALFGALIHRETHKTGFWIISGSGCLTVLGYVLFREKVTLQTADLLLLGATVSASLGYALGAQLTRQLSGLDVICCALVLVLPISIPAAVVSWFYQPPSGLTASALTGMVYVTLLSQLFGFVPWYKGLALGGVALVSQLQLLQTFFTLIISAWLLSESIGWVEYGVALLVIAQIYLAKKVA